MSAHHGILRASLLSDANKFASLRRWSIRQLLDFKLCHENSANHNIGGTASTATTPTPTSATVTANTKSLLQEVQIRLASQHSKLLSFSSSLDPYARIFKSEEVGGGGGVDIVHKNLSNLQILHENTYALLQSVTRGDATTASNTLTITLQQRYISNTFDEIMSRHGNSVEPLADIVLHVRDTMLPTLPSILRQPFLHDVKLLHEHEIEQYLHSRLMIQLLCEHYVSLHNNKKKKKKKSIGGAITLDGDIFDLIDDAATEARHVCDANLGVAPEVIIRKMEIEGAEDCTGVRDRIVSPPIIRSWLHHALVEVIKNAMTSNVQMMHRGMVLTSTTAGGAEPFMLPPSVHVRVRMEERSPIAVSDGDAGSCDGDSNSMMNTTNRYLVIQIIDQGIGVRDIDEAFGFARSSSRKRWDRLKEQQSYAAVRQPLGSLGVGLTLSRLMLRAFGGDLTLSNNHRGMTNGVLVSGCTATLMINCDDSYLAKN